ncbi:MULTISPECIES: phosphate ABC transporter substrate-binding protein PstS [unclassified Saccharibacter]|uniref:phosphate ABC transporter substrate-binding protein PstS n=1 Tax=unclassified Saccharibacter TaxID=2648722 RepID=UPI001325382E|nr:MULTISPECIES: phosphate ABC transporter substrate-binding protein PstS [unclassified Saccharibacter]MXV36503.1 phosphate ABC transporter substrate-binding protein PstS [Saccharibacter sp. EH611]MXV57665.1 phosphate ABC transporter substrate-binding protein PstS [Saccharibacter sp. EH70]MXV65028.1 phosphate ABC transporter substrate-binding protein PstS [Saccharibacter sp. EH60]
MGCNHAVLPNCFRGAWALMSVALVAPLSAHAASQAVTITGAGSSFAAPVYQSWSMPVATQMGVSVNYQSVGSSAGQDQVSARTIDFGASDKPMAAEKLAKNHLYQFPSVMSGVVVVVNLPGVPEGKLRLDGPTLAMLYDGTITEWNDPRIQALNPGVTLPDDDVAAIHRADGSGTSYVFTSYLSCVSSSWNDQIGAGTLVDWKGGAGGRGNDGVAALVKQTPGSLGYVEYSYASQNHLNIAQLKNHDGNFVSPSLEGFAEASKAADWQEKNHYAVSLLDQAGAGSWPIVSPTYVLIPEEAVLRPEGKGVHDFFAWGFEHGEEVNHTLGYVGLPRTVQESIMKSWPSSETSSSH